MLICTWDEYQANKTPLDSIGYFTGGHDAARLTSRGWWHESHHQPAMPIRKPAATATWLAGIEKTVMAIRLHCQAWQLGWVILHGVTHDRVVALISVRADATPSNWKTAGRYSAVPRHWLAFTCVGNCRCAAATARAFRVTINRSACTAGRLGTLAAVWPCLVRTVTRCPCNDRI